MVIEKQSCETTPVTNMEEAFRRAQACKLHAGGQSDFFAHEIAHQVPQIPMSDGRPYPDGRHPAASGVSRRACWATGATCSCTCRRVTRVRGCVIPCSTCTTARTSSTPPRPSPARNGASTRPAQRLIDREKDRAAHRRGRGQRRRGPHPRVHPHARALRGLRRSRAAAGRWRAGTGVSWSRNSSPSSTNATARGPEAEFTGLGGSSLGGLVTLVRRRCGSRRCSRRLAVMSPSVWWDDCVIYKSGGDDPAQAAAENLAGHRHGRARLGACPGSARPAHSPKAGSLGRTSNTWKPKGRGITKPRGLTGWSPC